MTFLPFRCRPDIYSVYTGIVAGVIEIDYHLIDDEERYVAVGVTNGGRLLNLVWTMREDVVRIVTAYDSPRQDEQLYLSRKG